MSLPIDDDDELLAIVAICLKKKEIEKRKYRKRLWMREQFKKRPKFTTEVLKSELNKCDKNDFRYFFKLNIELFKELSTLIGPLIKKRDTAMRLAIPVNERLWITLRYLATGCNYEEMQDECAVSPPAISRIVLETCEAINLKLKDYIQLPSTTLEWQNNAEDYFQKTKFPHCLGVIGGLHIAIRKNFALPQADQYFNYKNFLSLVLVTVVNANHEFIAADISVKGGTPDIEAIRQTPFGTAYYQNNLSLPNSKQPAHSDQILPYVFIGHKNFVLQQHFLMPFRDNKLSAKQKIFNERLNPALKCYEKTLNILISHFKVLKGPLNLTPEKVKTIVMACCYLHNFLKKKTPQQLWNEKFEAAENILEEMTHLRSVNTQNYPNTAIGVRENFMEYFNKEGKINLK